jgi:plasmid stabilization system protein ParE
MPSAQSLTFHVEISPRAPRDLRHILVYIHAKSSHQARIWFNGLEAAIASLDWDPVRGRVTPENQRLRELLYGKRRTSIGSSMQSTCAAARSVSSTSATARATGLRPQ